MTEKFIIEPGGIYKTRNDEKAFVSYCSDEAALYLVECYLYYFYCDINTGKNLGSRFIDIGHPDICLFIFKDSYKSKKLYDGGKILDVQKNNKYYDLISEWTY